MPRLLHANTPLETARLRLIPVTAEIARADASQRDRLGPLLGALVPDDWPPDLLADHLEQFAARLETATDGGDSPWYWLLKPPHAAQPTLMGSGGFFDLHDGRVILGYSILPDWYNRGLATEAVSALVDWVRRQPAITSIIADTFPTLPASIRVLEKCGFTRTGTGDEPGSIRFERKR